MELCFGGGVEGEEDGVEGGGGEFVGGGGVVSLIGSVICFCVERGEEILALAVRVFGEAGAREGGLDPVVELGRAGELAHPGGAGGEFPEVAVAGEVVGADDSGGEGEDSLDGGVDGGLGVGGEELSPDAAGVEDDGEGEGDGEDNEGLRGTGKGRAAVNDGLISASRDEDVGKVDAAEVTEGLAVAHAGATGVAHLEEPGDARDLDGGFWSHGVGGAAHEGFLGDVSFVYHPDEHLDSEGAELAVVARDVPGTALNNGGVGRVGHDERGCR